MSTMWWWYVVLCRFLHLILSIRQTRCVTDGHLTFECRNFIEAKKDEDEVTLLTQQRHVIHHTIDMSQMHIPSLIGIINKQ
jgi:hypothetical protein